MKKILSIFLFLISTISHAELEGDFKFEVLNKNANQCEFSDEPIELIYNEPVQNICHEGCKYSDEDGPLTIAIEGGRQYIYDAISIGESCPTYIETVYGDGTLPIARKITRRFKEFSPEVWSDIRKDWSKYRVGGTWSSGDYKILGMRYEYVYGDPTVSIERNGDDSVHIDIGVYNHVTYQLGDTSPVFSMQRGERTTIHGEFFKRCENDQWAPVAEGCPVSCGPGLGTAPLERYCPNWCDATYSLDLDGSCVCADKAGEVRHQWSDSGLFFSDGRVTQSFVFNMGDGESPSCELEVESEYVCTHPPSGGSICSNTGSQTYTGLLTADLYPERPSTRVCRDGVNQNGVRLCNKGVPGESDGGTGAPGDGGPDTGNGGPDSGTGSPDTGGGGDGSGNGGTGSGNGGAGSGTGGGGSGTGGGGSGTGGGGSGTGGTGTGSPGTGTGDPGTGTGDPGTGTGDPGTGTGDPGTGIGDPGTGTGDPGTGTGDPGTGTGDPGTGTGDPGTGTGDPGTGTGAPGTGTGSPGTGTGSPGTGTGDPGTGTGSPGTGTGNPGTGTGNPGTGTGNPGTGTGSPGTGTGIDTGSPGTGGNGSGTGGSGNGSGNSNSGTGGSGNGADGGSGDGKDYTGLLDRIADGIDELGDKFDELFEGDSPTGEIPSPEPSEEGVFDLDTARDEADQAKSDFEEAVDDIADQMDGFFGSVSGVSFSCPRYEVYALDRVHYIDFCPYWPSLSKIGDGLYYACMLLAAFIVYRGA